MPKIVTILLTHQSQQAVERMLSYWGGLDARQDFIIAYGGPDAEWQLQDPRVVRITDPLLRTKDHPRERQSYLGVFQAVLPRIKELAATHVHLAEFDEIPVVNDLNQRLLDLMEREQCDVLGHRLLRVDDTTQPHCMDHLRDAKFVQYWHEISHRKDKNVVLSMLGCGSFWTSRCFAAVAALHPPLRIYLELFLPTAAHHLGYRVRPIADQDAFMAPEIPKSEDDLEVMKAQGAWRVHPVKRMWTQQLGA
jgi:hypothetical protein